LTGLASLALAGTPRTKEAACRLFAERIVAARRERDSLTVEDAARAAWHPCHRLTLAQLEDKIRAGRERREAAARATRSA
jgi:hypothetical protein